jgi:hypothetical protein
MPAKAGIQGYGIIQKNCKWIPASLENTPNTSLPLAGGDEGEGEEKLFTPTLSLSHRRGRGIN